MKRRRLLALRGYGGTVVQVKHPLFFDEVLVHEATESVGVAKVTYYPIDGMLKGIKIGLELLNAGGAAAGESGSGVEPAVCAGNGRIAAD